MSRRDIEAWDRLYEGDGRPWKGDVEERFEIAGKVLELGVGNGKSLSALPKGADVVGLDHSRRALISCGRSFQIPLVRGDASSLPFRDGCFSFVVISHLLGHLSQHGRSQVAREVVRVLGEGGKVYVSVFGEEDMRCGKGLEVEEMTFERGNGIVCHYFREGEVPSLFPTLRQERSWVRSVDKRFHGRDERRQERRFLLVK